ncbi:MAG: undecaprenyldiphospho-muramoylpentapeptide beta-N-acetylglucosaminyltransferase [Gammaproteobacteria bacterium RIFCSPHIGHO2_12_FULL_41_20]|nr:MAG: undecaprenyldiphospho-muramoylpentapeptide beta-N-acetylglucosaminyltransferase [Gammaproteobacteria bacterium RIFCSPHIGHO2_12_FULL_41_20]
MSELRSVLIMAGGTGGHVFPGLALAHYMRDQGVQVYWLGTQQGIEVRLVPEAGFALYCIAIHGLRGKSWGTRLLAPWRLVRALWQSLCLLRQLKPQVVIGMGGFASGPGGMASWLLGYPLVIHEQNAKAGFTNKILFYFSRKVLTGFPRVFSKNGKIVMTGNPVRHELMELPPPQERLLSAKPEKSKGEFNLLILGGSLGAQVLNQVVPKALARLAIDERPKVYHQAGEKNLAETKKAYMLAGVEGEVVPFIDEMSKAYGWADMVLCRAGALTIAELCAVGLGAILVPYPYAVDDHQTANADYMVQHGAAVLISQPQLTEEYLATVIKQLSCNPERRLGMAQAAYGLRNLGVVEKVFGILREVSH